MPHCIIEYSKALEHSLQINELVKEVHQSAVLSELFTENTIKTRAIAYEHYQVGTSDDGFVHISMRILQGRNHNQKKLLSRLVLSRLQAILSSAISLSVEVIDIDKVCYSKVVC